MRLISSVILIFGWILHTAQSANAQSSIEGYLRSATTVAEPISEASIIAEYTRQLELKEPGARKRIPPSVYMVHFPIKFVGDDGQMYWLEYSERNAESLQRKMSSCARQVNKTCKVILGKSTIQIELYRGNHNSSPRAGMVLLSVNP
jgi:hypothetical protein